MKTIDKSIARAKARISGLERDVHIQNIKIDILQDLGDASSLQKEKEATIQSLKECAEESSDRWSFVKELAKLQSYARIRGMEARALHLAYGFLKGMPYNQIENPRPGNEPDKFLIRRMLDKLKPSEADSPSELETWLSKTNTQLQAA